MHDDSLVLCVLPRHLVREIEAELSLLLQRMFWDAFARWLQDYHNVLDLTDEAEEPLELLCLESFGSGVDPQVLTAVAALLQRTRPLMASLRRRVQAEGRGVVAIHPWTEYERRSRTPYLVLQTRPLALLLDGGLEE